MTPPGPYPTLNRTSASILASAILSKPRGFSQDARAFTRRLQPPLRLLGSYPADPGGGLVITVNHYSRPGFGAWWIALALAATCPWDMHWTVTSAWVYADRLRSLLITPPSRWLLARLARIYSFTAMPPMPPRPQDLAARAQAVRGLLQYVEAADCPVLGFAPEGADSAAGRLSPPPAGVGRFLAMLVERGLKILPAAVFEDGAGLVLALGKAAQPDLPADRRTLDECVSAWTMQAIAGLLPASLRGAYA